MKILYNIHSLHIGGAETVAANYLLALKEKGHEVVLVLDEREESFLQERVDKAGIRTVSLRPQNSYSFFGKVKRVIALHTIDFEKRWARILAEEKPDVVHLHSHPWQLPFPAERTVYTFHAEVERILGLYGERYRAQIRRLADRGVSFFCLSGQAEKTVRRIFQTGRTALIPNGVALEQIRAGRYDRGTFLRSLEIPESAFIMGHVGRLQPVKNHPKLLQVFAEAAKRRDAYLLLVGGGEPEYTEKIKAQARELGIHRRVVFLGVRSDAARIMGVFDALVLPSVAESFSLTLVEAQALGVRCVASDVVPPEVVCNDNCFTLSLKEPAEKWADYALGEFTGEKGGSLERFGMSAVTDALIRAYRALLPSEEASI